MPDYYIVRTGPDRFDMRQTRYAEAFKAGREHPHDLMAVGFNADDMRDMLRRYFPKASIDASALPELKIGPSPVPARCQHGQGFNCRTCWPKA